MTTYTRRGAGHRILAALDEQPATLEELVAASGTTRRARNAAAFVVPVLRRDGLIAQFGEVYALTPSGRCELIRLRGSAAPRVQVFGRRAA